MSVARRRGLRRLAVVAVCAAALATGGVVASRWSDAASSVGNRSSLHSSGPLVAVFGDSLITQAKLDLAADLSKLDVVQHSDPGVAACHYLAVVRSFLRTHRPKVAVIEFWGNDNKDTSCVNRFAMQSAGYDANYQRTISTMVREFVDAGTHVFLVGTIPDATEVATADTKWDRLNRIYAGIAASYHHDVVSFVNVQQVIELDGHFTWYLPCLPHEQSCDDAFPALRSLLPVGDNVVRSIDGLHFCPDYPTTPHHYYDIEFCDTYSSGEFRYASFIAQAVEQFLELHLAPKFIGDPLPASNRPVEGIAGQVDPYTGAVYPQR
jgi:hypothetical protein